MLATLWAPNMNPIGPGSIWPLGIVVGYAAITWLSKWRVLKFAAPIIFALAAVLSDGYLFGGRRFPNADDFVGYYIWLLASCCFAMEIACSGSRGSLFFGGVVIFPLGWLLTLDIFGRSLGLLASTRALSVRQITLASTLVWCALFALLIVRASRTYLREDRLARGLCASCGYDMRQSPARCPECGEPVSNRPAA